MKKIVLFFIVITSSVYGQSIDSLFVKANELYKDNNFIKAVELYETIEQKGFQSAELYYNLGNSYYKLDKVAPSIFNYEKALKLDPLHQDAINNLAFAKRMTIDNIEVLPQSFLQRFSKNVIQKFTFNTWAWLAVFSTFLTVIFFLLYYFSYSSRNKFVFFNLSLLFVFLLVITTAFAYQNYGYLKNNKEAIIFTQKVEVKNAPTMNSDEVFILHEGTKVLVLDEVDNWKKIKIADGKIGWLLKEDIKELGIY